MTDPNTVQEYEKATRYISRAPGYDPGMVADRADAAIRDLKTAYGYVEQRAEQAEATIERWIRADRDNEAWAMLNNLLDHETGLREKAEAAHAACSEKLRTSNAVWIAEKGRREQAEAELDENTVTLAETLALLGAEQSRAERLKWREKELHEFLNWKPQDAQDRYVYGGQQPKGSFRQVREFVDCLAARYEAVLARRAEEER